MRDAVVVEAVRTPVGKRNSALSGVHPVDLSARVLQALAERSGIDPGLVDDVIWGCVGQGGEQTFDIARNAVLAAGWPLGVPGTTVDRQCGSSQQSVHFAAAGLISGQYDMVVAGGVESMSRVPMGAVLGDANPFGSALETRFGESRRTRASAPRRWPNAGDSRVPGWTSSRSPPTRRPRQHRTTAALPRRSHRSPWTTGWSWTPMRGSAAAARWRSWPVSSPPSSRTG